MSISLSQKKIIPLELVVQTWHCAIRPAVYNTIKIVKTAAIEGIPRYLFLCVKAICKKMSDMNIKSIERISKFRASSRISNRIEVNIILSLFISINFKNISVK
tara:strand:- start:529 stop:837 length:309 start_codon:yes stop_codon:yes gene_type:complete